MLVASGTLTLSATPLGRATIGDWIVGEPSPRSSLAPSSPIKGDLEWMDTQFKQRVFVGFEDRQKGSLSAEGGAVCLKNFASMNILRGDQDLLVVCIRKDCIWIVPESSYARLAPKTTPLDSSFEDFNREFYGTSVLAEKRCRDDATLILPDISKRLECISQVPKSILNDAKEYGYVLIGLGDRVELWPTNRWSSRMTELAQRSDHTLETPFFSLALLDASETEFGRSKVNLFATRLLKGCDLNAEERIEFDRFIIQLSAWQTDGPGIFAFLLKNVWSLDDLKRYRKQCECGVEDPETLFRADYPAVPENSSGLCRLEIEETLAPLDKGPFEVVALPNLDAIGLKPVSHDFAGETYSGDHLPIGAYFNTPRGRRGRLPEVELYRYGEGHYVLAPKPSDRTPPLPGLFDWSDFESAIYSHGLPLVPKKVAPPKCASHSHRGQMSLFEFFRGPKGEWITVPS